MNPRIRRTALAKQDVRQIALWIGRQSPDAAIKRVDDLEQRLEELLNAPGSGTDRSDLRPSLRSSPFGNYLVFFKRIRDGIQIVRVLHGARDYSRFFKNNDE